MQRVLRSLAIALVLVAAGRWALRERREVPGPPPPPIEQSTEVKGAVPDLAGRWLAVVHVDVGHGAQRRTLASAFEVGGTSGAVVVRERFVQLPAPQKAAVERASAENQWWSPTPADVAAVADAWATLRPEDRYITSVTNELIARDAFDQQIAGDADFAPSAWVLRQSYGFQPAQARPMRQLTVYGARERTEAGWSGRYATVMVAAAPFPVPIAFQGTFRLYPLEPPPPCLAGRLGGLLAGCGR